jgi:hypothetical protein
VYYIHIISVLKINELYCFLWLSYLPTFESPGDFMRDDILTIVFFRDILAFLKFFSFDQYEHETSKLTNFIGTTLYR